MSEAERDTSGGLSFKLVFVILLVVSALGAIAYLSGQLNAYKYYLVRQERALTVHRGAPIPFVTRPFVASTESERIAYAPIEIPARWEGPSRQSFADRSALDRGIFAIMEMRLKDEFYSGRLPNMERVTRTMQRIQHLSGLNDEDRQRLDPLRGDFAYLRAREIVDGLPARLNEARRLCDEAERYGTGTLGDPRQFSDRLGRWMRLFSESPIGQAIPSNIDAEDQQLLPLPPPLVPSTPVTPEPAPEVDSAEGQLPSSSQTPL